MCLYPRFMKNPKYKPNKKNGGKPPKITDKRVEYVPVGCGKCIEQAAKLNYDLGEQAANNADARARAIYTDFNSPEARVKQLEDAGLSTSLMYGSGGGGGGIAAATTASQGSGAGGQQGENPQGYMEGAQLGLMLAQIRNLNADADKKKAEAAKTAGVDTQAQEQSIEESKQRVNKLVTEIGNNMLDAANKQMQNSFDAIRNEIQTIS